MSDAPHTWHRWGEPLAVALNIAYTLGYQAGEAWAFPAGGFGSALFLVICWQRQLKLEAFLWLYYIGMAGYGAWAVQSAWPDPLPTASLEAHALSIGLGLIAWWALSRFFQGKSWRPRLDAFTTVGSLIATYWMLQFVHANWLYWIVINAVSVVLYVSRGLKWGTGLFVLYTLLALEGWFNFIPQL